MANIEVIKQLKERPIFLDNLGAKFRTEPTEDGYKTFVRTADGSDSEVSSTSKGFTDALVSGDEITEEEYKS